MISAIFNDFQSMYHLISAFQRGVIGRKYQIRDVCFLIKKTWVGLKKTIFLHILEAAVFEIIKLFMKPVYFCFLKLPFFLH